MKVMMNTYLRKVRFEIDGKVIRSNESLVLIDESTAQLGERIKATGSTFNSLWDYMHDNNGYLVPATTWIKAFWSNKRRIEFFHDAKTWVDNGTEIVWKITVVEQPYTVSMTRLLEFDAEDVIQYFRERNLVFTIDK